MTTRIPGLAAAMLALSLGGVGSVGIDPGGTVLPRWQYDDQPRKRPERRPPSARRLRNRKRRGWR